MADAEALMMMRSLENQNRDLVDDVNRLQTLEATMVEVQDEAPSLQRNLDEMRRRNDELAAQNAHDLYEVRRRNEELAAQNAHLQVRNHQLDNDVRRLESRATITTPKEERPSQTSNRRDLDAFLRCCGCSQYATNFRDGDITDVDNVELLSDLDLKDIGLPVGPRRRIQQALVDYNASTPTTTQPTTTQPTTIQPTPPRRSHRRSRGRGTGATNPTQ